MRLWIRPTQGSFCHLTSIWSRAVNVKSSFHQIRVMQTQRARAYCISFRLWRACSNLLLSNQMNEEIKLNQIIQGKKHKYEAVYLNIAKYKCRACTEFKYLRFIFKLIASDASLPTDNARQKWQSSKMKIILRCWELLSFIGPTCEQFPKTCQSQQIFSFFRFECNPILFALKFENKNTYTMNYSENQREK